MIVNETGEYLDEVMALAKKIGKEKNFEEQLNYLHNYANGIDTPEEDHKTMCHLYKDFAPASFSFVMKTKNNEGVWVRWFNGGLIFHGSHDGFGSGAAPTLSVCINPTDGWSIHT